MGSLCHTHNYDSQYNRVKNDPIGSFVESKFKPNYKDESMTVELTILSTTVL